MCVAGVSTRVPYSSCVWMLVRLLVAELLKKVQRKPGHTPCPALQTSAGRGLVAQVTVQHVSDSGEATLAAVSHNVSCKWSGRFEGKG